MAFSVLTNLRMVLFQALLPGGGALRHGAGHLLPLLDPDRDLRLGAVPQVLHRPAHHHPLPLRHNRGRSCGRSVGGKPRNVCMICKIFQARRACSRSRCTTSPSRAARALTGTRRPGAQLKLILRCETSLNIHFIHSYSSPASVSTIEIVFRVR